MSPSPTGSAQGATPTGSLSPQTPTASPTEAQDLAPPFRRAPRGCSMSHCDPRMSDGVGMGIPSQPMEIRWRDPAAAGSNYGLGCSGNGQVVACSLGGEGRPGPYLKVYDSTGAVLWSSDLLNSSAFTSAPLVEEGGGVIACDSERIIRFDPHGDVLWETLIAGGLPISPVITERGTIAVATRGGPLSIYDPQTGELLDALYLEAEYDGTVGIFDTRNTPAVKGNRLYVSTELGSGAGGSSYLPIRERPARLIAVDVDIDAAPGERLRVAWYFEFGARSGSSPLLIGDTVYFDGDRLSPGGEESPHFFAVQDLGDEGSLKWTAENLASSVASASQDPRGGLWTFAQDQPWLRRLSEENGDVIQQIDLDALVGEEGIHVPLSAMTMGTGPAGENLMVVTAAEAKSYQSFVLALDLDPERTDPLLWKVPYADNLSGWSAGQYPIVIDERGEPVIVFTTYSSGIIGLGTAGR